MAAAFSEVVSNLVRETATYWLNGLPIDNVKALE